MGDVAVLNAETVPGGRPVPHGLAVALGQVKVVIGTRAVMCRPLKAGTVRHSGGCRLSEPGRYDAVSIRLSRETCRFGARAKSHGGVFVSHGQMRAIRKVSGKTPVQVRWKPGERLFHRDSSARLAAEGCDALGALAQSAMSLRVSLTRPSGRACRIRPSACYLKVLESGPVLLSIPQDNVSETLSCAKCHRQARCAKCSGPLSTAGRPPGFYTAMPAGVGCCHQLEVPGLWA